MLEKLKKFLDKRNWKLKQIEILRELSLEAADHIKPIY